MASARDVSPLGTASPVSSPLPQLYFTEGTWDLWRGSPVEVSRLAMRADRWVRRSFGAVPEHFVTSAHSVSTTRWAGGPVATAELSDEIDARRSLVTRIDLESEALPRSMLTSALDAASLQPARLPSHLDAGTPDSDGVSAPVRIALTFQTKDPAVTLRVIASSPAACLHLYKHMAEHIEAGARPRVWLPESGAALGAFVGAAIPDILLLAAGLPPWWTMLLQFILGAAGWYGAAALVRWTFPPLELVEAWEPSRWDRVRLRAWQLLALVLAVTGIVIAVVLSQPSS